MARPANTIVDPQLLDYLQVDCGSARPPPLKTTIKNDFLRSCMFEANESSQSAKLIAAFKPSRGGGEEEPMTKEERAVKLKEVLAKYTSEEKLEFMDEAKKTSARVWKAASEGRTEGPLKSDYSGSTSGGSSSILKSGQKARSQAFLAGSPARDSTFSRKGSVLGRSSSFRQASASLRGEAADDDGARGTEDDRGRTRTRSVTGWTNKASLDPRDPNWAPAHPDPMPMYRAPPLFKSQISNLKANLSALPIECLENVAHFLDGNDLLNLGATCIRLYDFSCLDYIWKIVVNSRFKQMNQLTPAELEHVPPSDKPFKTLFFFLAKLRKPAAECRVKGLNGAFMAKITDLGSLSKNGCIWMKNAALLNIGTTFHGVKAGRYSLVWRVKLDDAWVPDETTFEVVRTQRTQDHFKREVSLLKKEWNGKEWTIQERKNGKGKWFKVTLGLFLLDADSNLTVTVVNESGNSKYGVSFDYVELWPLEGSERLSNDLRHQQEEENERQRLDHQKFKEDKRRLNEQIQAKIEARVTGNNMAPSMTSSEEDELPEALRRPTQTRETKEQAPSDANGFSYDLSDDEESLSGNPLLEDVPVLDNLENEVGEYKKYVELRMKFAKHFGKGQKREKIVPGSVDEAKWLEKSRKYLEQLQLTGTSSTSASDQVDREMVADTLRYPPPSVARSVARDVAPGQRYAEPTEEPPEDLQYPEDLEDPEAPDPMTWSMHENIKELDKKTRNPRVRAARQLMKGLGELLDVGTKREPTVVRDKTMTPAAGERGRSRTVTVMRMGDHYDEIESSHAVEAQMKKKRRQIAVDLLDRGDRLRRHRMGTGPGLLDAQPKGPLDAESDHEGGSSQESYPVPSYGQGPVYGTPQYGQGVPGMYGPAYGAPPSQAPPSEDPFAEIYAEEMANRQQPMMAYPGAPPVHMMQPAMTPHPQMGMGAPMPYGMPMMMPSMPYGMPMMVPSMGVPSMGAPSIYSGASSHGMMYPQYPMMPYTTPMNPMTMSMTKARADQVWNTASKNYDQTVRSQTVPPERLTGNESSKPDSLAREPEVATSGARKSRPRVTLSRGSSPDNETCFSSAPEPAPTASTSESEGTLPSGLGPLARAEREISQVKSSKARSSAFKETRSSLARAPSAPKRAGSSVLEAGPTEARNYKSKVETHEEKEQRKAVLKDCLERASNYEVDGKPDKKKIFPMTVKLENERYERKPESSRSFDQVPFPVTTDPLELRRNPVDRENLQKLYYAA